MATKPVVPTIQGEKSTTFKWAGLLNGDDGDPVAWNAYADRSVQFSGAFGVGGTVILEGSNDKTNWFQLNDASLTLISATAAKLKQVLETTLWVRPRVTAGDGSTAIDVVIFARKVF